MKQPEALRLADGVDPMKRIFLDNLTCAAAAAELRRLHALNAELVEALTVAVTQNDHDMLMTGEELRMCADALSKAKEQP